MKHPLQEQLALFRRQYRRLAAELILEAAFLPVGILLLAAAWLDYSWWRWRLSEIYGLRWGVLLIFIAFLAFYTWKSLRFLRRLPQTPLETLHFLRAMNRNYNANLKNVPQDAPKITSKTAAENTSEVTSGMVSEITSEVTSGMVEITSEAADKSGAVPVGILCEKRFPQQLPFESLESAVDFLEKPQPEEAQELSEAVIARADAVMTHFIPEFWLEMAFSRRMRWGIRCAAVFLIMLFAVISVQCGENTQIALKRFCCPWENCPWKIDFHPQWKVLPEEVLYGGTFDAELSLRKRAPFLNVALWYERESEKSSDVPSEILRVTPIFGRYFVRIPDVKVPFSVSVFMEGENPAESVRHPVQIRTYAHLTNAILRVAPPSVPGGPSEESGWEIKGLPGSSAGIMIAADRPLKDARIRFENGTYIPGVPSEYDSARTVFKFRFEILRDCRYFLELTDDEGLTARLETHEIHTTTDLPPIPSFTLPVAGREVLPGARIQLSLDAQDDFGVASLGFRWISESPVKTGTSSVSSMSENNEKEENKGNEENARNKDSGENGKTRGDEKNKVASFLVKDGFSTPVTRAGTPKWTHFQVWNAENGRDGENKENKIRNKTLKLPFTAHAAYEWDLAPISLEAGMRLRIQPTACDAGMRESAAGNELFLYIISPEEMQQKTFRQWLGMTQELRRLGNAFITARKMLEKGLTPENVSPVSESLSRCMRTAAEILTPGLSDSIPAQMALLESDFSENPEFLFSENVTSRQQLEELRRLKRLLTALKLNEFSALNREIVELQKMQQIRLGKPLSEEYLRAKEVKIQVLLKKNIAILFPLMKIWNREEFFESMRTDFEKLQALNAETFHKTMIFAEKVRKMPPAELRIRNLREFQNISASLWNLRLETEHFFTRYHEILEMEENSEAASERTSEKTSGRLSGSAKEMKTGIFQCCDSAVSSLNSGYYYDLCHFMNKMASLFSTLDEQWIQPQNTNLVQKKLQIFSRVQKSQEDVLHFLEEVKAESRIRTENPAGSGNSESYKASGKVIPLKRSERFFLQECAEFQEIFSTYFENSCVFLPRALKPQWKTLYENLNISVEEFRTLSELSVPPLEMVEDQYTLQLQIYDELAELAMIINGMPEMTGTFVKNSDFENRVEKKDASEDENGGKTPSDAGDSESAGSEEVEIQPEDIQILISMQRGVAEQTEELQKNTVLSASEKAEEVEFLAEQERKITESAKALGFGARSNSAFDGLLSQMFQVVFLFEKQDIGEMNLSIQHEILYGLQNSLRREETSEETSAGADREAAHEEENLSENTDSQAVKDAENAENKGDNGNKEREEDENSENTEDKDSLNALNSGGSRNEAESAKEILKKLQNSFWGELPVRRRQELELLPEEKMIPEYRQMNERYFRNLNSLPEE